MTEDNYNLPRIEKVKVLREKGINPYPNDVSPDSLCRDLIARFGPLDAAMLEAQSGEFSLAGRLLMKRSFGKAGFLKIRDRSGEIQIFCQKDSLTNDEFEIYKDLDIGDFIWVKGKLFRTKTNELTLKAGTLRLAAKRV